MVHAPSATPRRPYTLLVNITGSHSSCEFSCNGRFVRALWCVHPSQPSQTLTLTLSLDLCACPASIQASYTMLAAA